MKSNLYDDRQSLWDLGLREISIESHQFEILEPPMRGGNCLVYKAKKFESANAKKYEHLILLKEFYPILNTEKNESITRKTDGSFYIPAGVKASSSYQRRLQRFLDSYELMLELSKKDDSIDHAVTVHSLTESHGTWYIEEAFDSGKLFFDYVGITSISNFLNTLKYCFRTVGFLHELGYYHLDLKPNNLSFTRSGVLRFFDTDSMVKESDLGTYADFPESGGFSAPELSQAIARPFDAPYLIGPWTDIYSLAQFICYYLFNKPVTYFELLDLLPELENHIQFTDYYENDNWIAPEQNVYMQNGVWRITYNSNLMSEDEDLTCHPLIPRNGLFLLKCFLLKALHPDFSKRYQNIFEAYKDLSNIIEKFSNFNSGLIDRFEEMIPDIFYHEEELDALESNLLEDIKTIEIKKRDLFGEYTSEIEQPGLHIVEISSSSVQTREEFAKYYATLNRERYDTIHEIRGTDLETALWDLRFFQKNTAFLEDHLSLAISNQKNPTLIIFYDESNKTAPVNDGDYLHTLYNENLDNLHILFVGSKGRIHDLEKNSELVIPHISLDNTSEKKKAQPLNKVLHKFSWNFISLGLMLAGLYSQKLAIPPTIFLIQNFYLSYWIVEYVLYILIGALCFTLFLHGYLYRWSKRKGAITNIRQYLKKYSLLTIVSFPFLVLARISFSDVTVLCCIISIFIWILFQIYDEFQYYHGTFWRFFF